MSQIFRDDSEKYHEYGWHQQKRLIRLMGEIDEAAAQQFIANMTLLDEGPGGKKQEPIIIDIYSIGGDAIAGWAIYDRIRQSPSFVTGRVWGEASSAASFILQACDERHIDEHAALMLHEGSHDAGEDHNRNAEAAAAQIPIYRKFMIKIFARAMCRSEQFIESFLIIDKYIYAEEALRKGLVDKILENSEPEWYTDEYREEIRRRVKRDRNKKK